MRLPTSDALDRFYNMAVTSGFEFPLEATSSLFGQEMVARVRKISLSERMVIDALPHDVQQLVWDVIKTAQAEEKNPSAQKALESTTLEDYLSNLGGNMTVMKKAACAAFIYPRLVMTRAELPATQDPDNPVWLVDHIDNGDLIRLWNWINGEGGRANNVIKLFRDEPAENVANSGPLPLATAPVGSDGARSGWPQS